MIHTLRLRRRLDQLGLRLQARLDAAWADRVLPWGLAATLTTVCIAIGLATQRQLDGGSALAVWSQAAWSLQHGAGTTSSLAGGDPVFDQWAFATVPLLWVAGWTQVGPALAIAQGVLFGLAIPPLWRIAREAGRLRLGTSVAVVLAFAASPIVHATNLAGWTAPVPAVPAIAWAAWFGFRERWAPYWLCIGLALVSRGDIGLCVAGLGVVGIATGARRVGVLTTALGLAWSAAALVATDPSVPQGPLTASGVVLARGTVSLAVLGDPMRVVTDLLVQPNLAALISVIGPLIFLPLTAPRYLVPAASPVILGLVGEEAIRGTTEPGIVSPLGPPVLTLALVPVVLATVVALSRIGRRSTARIRVDHRIVAALLFSTAAFFIQVAPASPFNEPWGWGSRDATDGARLEAIRRLPDDAAVTVSPQLSAMVADRPVVREIPLGPPPPSWRPSTPTVVLDTNADEPSGRALWDDGDRRDAIAVLLDQGFRPVYDAQGIFVLRR